MSTKIYNGFRLAEGTDPAAFKHAVRNVMDPLRDQEDLKLLAVEVAKYVDGQWIAGAPILAGAAGAAYTQWADAQRKMSVNDYDHDPNRFELSIGADPGNDRIMVIARAENRLLLEAFEDLPGVEEYGYWNNSDSYPEGVTRGDWEVRAAAWNRMLPGTGQISKTMDTWVLRDTVEIRDELRSTDGTGTERMVSHAPAGADRARDKALEDYADYLVKHQGVEPFRAVQHVAFGRGKPVRPVIDTVASFMPALTVDLLTEGSHGAVIAPGFRDAVDAACAALYEQDKTELARKD